jgi:tetratricopeptide (TPR) repeat protein
MESNVEQLPVSHKAWAWFEANKRPALWGGGVLLVVGVIVAFVLYRQSEQEVAASEALSSVSASRLTGADSSAATAQAYLKVASEYPSTQAGARALLLAAGSLFTEAKYPEAKAEFEKFRREHGDSPFLGEALLGIAACLDAQGNAREAMTAYRDLITRRPTDYVLPQARFALARLCEAQNEPEQARNLYEEVERSDPYSSLAAEAGMRLEDLKAKHPNLFAPPAPPPSSLLAPPPTKVAPSTNVARPAISMPPSTNAGSLRIVPTK